MFESEDFSSNEILYQIVIKLDKFFEKNKSVKIEKIISQLEDLLSNEDLIVPLTYILSIIAENAIEFITEDLIIKIEPFLKSQNIKLKTNSIIILGFKILSDERLIDKYIADFTNLLMDDVEDIKENIHYFLGRFFDTKPNVICSQKKRLFKVLREEHKKENLNALLTYIYICKDLSFNELFYLREISQKIISNHDLDKELDIKANLTKVLKKFYPSLNIYEMEDLNGETIRSIVDNLFIMKRINFTELSKKKSDMTFETFTDKVKKHHLKDKELYFYTKNRKTNEIIFYFLEREKLNLFFDKDKKISDNELNETFGSIINSKYNMKLFIDVLLNLGQIKGYYSKLGFFYPQSYISLKLKADAQKKGLINLKNYDHLPEDTIKDQIKNISESSNIIFLTGINEQSFYSLKKIQDQINTEAARNSSIDLNPFRERLKDEDFILLIKNLPKEYLTNLRKGTHWLTNIGKTNIRNEIENSKIIGYFNLPIISEKLNIKKILLIDVLEQYIDLRGGIWDNNKEVFYYSKFLKEKIDSINLMINIEEKTEKINELADQLNINKNIILTKINENLKLLGDEIKNQDQIDISEYLDKLGMDREMFMNFIHDLELNYFLKGDSLILNPEKIELAKKDIKAILIKEANTVDYINFGNFDINADLVHSLIKELKQKEQIKGIFHKENGEILFHTVRGIKNMMLENSMLFSFSDLFYNKDLDEKEISLLKEVLDELINSRQLKGTFDKESLTFSSEDVIFAKDYNIIVDDFGRIVDGFTKKFDKEFQVIKKILLKRDEVIYPQEIKLIQEIIDRININYVKWRAQIESIIISTNKRILDEQGYTFKRYQNLPEDKKREIILFREDPDVLEIVENFNSWVNLFNELELNYGKIIFAQKRLINNPEDTETEIKLENLLENLNLL